VTVELPLLLTGVAVTGFLCQWLAWRVKLPAILFLLLAGILAGPVTGLLDPDALLGPLLMPFVSLAVAIILFEGSLTLRLGEARELGITILRLVLLGALVTLAVLAAAAHLLAGFGWPLALLFGAIACVTGPTVIIPMLRSVRPNERVSNLLRWEGILIDPIGALLAVLMFQVIVSGTHGPDSWRALGVTVATGIAAGLAGAASLAWALRRHFVPEYLKTYAALAVVLLAYTVSDSIAHESGLLAVTVMGVVLANLRDLHLDDILDFKENLSTLLISTLFILLAARLDPAMPLRAILAGIGVLIVAQAVARPLAVLAATLGTSITWKERALLAWIAPRGIVAAAVSALLALRLQEMKYPDAELLVPLTFLLIIGTVVVQSATAGRLARHLGVADPLPRGVLVVGSTPLARAIAEALHAQKLPVLVVDDDWNGIRAARMGGLQAFFGNAVSEHADRHLDLIGIGNLFAMSTRRELNSLACVRYRPEFGAHRVFFLRDVVARGDAARAEFASSLSAPRLFGDEITHTELTARFEAGWRIKSTRLGENFGVEQFQAQHGGRALALFAVDETGRLRVAASDRKLDPRPGWQLVALVPPEENTAAAPSAAARAGNPHV